MDNEILVRRYTNLVRAKIVGNWTQAELTMLIVEYKCGTKILVHPDNVMLIEKKNQHKTTITKKRVIFAQYL